MKPTTKLRRAPRQKEGETDKAYQARLRAYERDKAVREYERNSPQGIIDPDDDLTVTPEQAAIIARVEKDMLLLSSQEPEWEAEKEAFLEKHHAEHQAERRATLVAVPTGKEGMQEAPGDLDPILSRLDELLDRVGGLERHVDKLSRLVAATLPARALKPAAKAAVLELAPEMAEAFKDERVRELYETYEHVVNMGRGKKITANFPKPIWGELVRAGIDNTEIVCRIIPHSALIARCAAKKVFRVMEDEESAVQNVKFTLAKSGLIVTTMHSAGLKRGSQVKIVMDHAEAVKRGLVKGLEPVPEILPRATFDKGAWHAVEITEDAPELEPNRAWKDAPVIENEEEPLVIKKGNPRFAEWEEPEPDTVDIVEDEPPTTNAVEDEIDTEPWEEEEEQPDEDFALFRTPEEPQKSSRAVDLFAD